MAIPIGLLFNAVQIFASGVPPLQWVQQYFNDSNAGKFTATLLVLGLQQIAMLLLISPAIVFAMGEIRQGIKPGVWRSYVEGFRHIVSLSASLAILVVALLVLSWTIVLIPLAIYLLVRWQFFSQAIILDGQAGATAPLAQSWRLTYRRWFWTLLVTVAFQLLGTLPGPLVGVLMLIVGGANVRFANAFSSFLYAIFVPLAVIGITLAYRRLKGEPIIEPHIQTREREAAKAEQMRAMEEDALRRMGEGLPG